MDRETGVRRAAVLAWAALAAAVAGQALLFPQSHSVFPVYAEAAAAARRAGHLYPLGVHGEYRYSPLFALLMVPFAALPAPWGGACWKAINVAAAALGLLAFSRGVVPASSDPGRDARLLLWSLPLVLISAYNGQANLLALACMLLGLRAVAVGRGGWGSAVLVLAVFVKAYPLALVALVAALQPALIVPALGGVGVFLALPALNGPAWAWSETTAWLALLAGTPGIRKPGYRSFDQLLAQLGLALPPAAYAALTVLAGLAALGLAWDHARRRPERREQLTRTYALFATWAVLFGPAAEAATYVLLAPALAWALHRAWTTGAPPGERLWLLAALLLTGPLATDVLGGAVRRAVTEHGGLPLGATLFAAYLVRHHRRPEATA